MVNRKRTDTKDRGTLLYALAYIMLAVFTYGVEKDIEFNQAAMYVDYN